ncbi:MAG TPA: methyltransferase domain-containing protein [Burkholderiales bacterium]|nr:methyltransferase domain-containing protein [Burkholderiales bacterium]
MSDSLHNSQSDVWTEWLFHRRHADDPVYHQSVQARVNKYADHVLEAAHLAPDMTLADIGSGEGLVAFRAIERIGPSLKLILTDISAPMLSHAEKSAIQRGVRSQCRFLECPAENLKEIADASVDIITTRAVLAYVQNKTAALCEFHRILKPGGRISIAEPIFQDEAFAARALKHAVDAQTPQTHDRFLILLHRWKASQFPDNEEQMTKNPLTNYSERDLLRFTQNSGFTEIHMELHIDVLPSPVISWKTFLNNSPHPWAPSLNSVMDTQFSSEEQQFFEQILRPAIEAPSVTTDRIVYLTAKKPLS